MNIITILTKRSTREILKERKFLKYYSSKSFFVGDMLEIIDGNKKSRAIILKIQSASDLKEEIRSGKIEMKKLKLSKTGEFSDGKLIENFSINLIKKLLRSPDEILKNTNDNIRGFFPKKRMKIKTKDHYKKTKNTGASKLSDILENKILGKEKKYYSPMQELVDIIRNYFNEKAVYGQGSFSYYIGFFKNIPSTQVYRIFSEVKQTKKSNFDQKKLF